MPCPRRAGGEPDGCGRAQRGDSDEWTEVWASCCHVKTAWFHVGPRGSDGLTRSTCRRRRREPGAGVGAPAPRVAAHEGEATATAHDDLERVEVGGAHCAHHRHERVGALPADRGHDAIGPVGLDDREVVEYEREVALAGLTEALAGGGHHLHGSFRALEHVDDRGDCLDGTFERFRCAR